MKIDETKIKTRFTFPAILAATVEKYGNSNALGFVDEKPLTYSEVGKRVNALIAMLEKLGIKKNDKVALLSPNMPNWGIAYFAITSMGAVVIPILNDFSVAEIENIISHSESKIVFVSKTLLPKVKYIDKSIINIMMDDFTLLKEDNRLFFEQDAICLNKYDIKEDDLAAIIYTSGTTGRSKGVMLTHRNICFTAYGGSLIQPMTSSDRFLSVLPLSHTYENTLGLILPVMFGAAVWYLRKPPTPSVLLPALEVVKPTVILTVPLIIEKIYFNKILPSFNGKFITKILYRMPPFRKLLNRIAGKMLKKTFGSNLKFFGIGGTKLNKTVEKFLMEAKFPYAIGYGLTEASPLLAGAPPFSSVLESTGPAMNGVSLKIISPDPKTGEGEIWAKGENIMKGYYKEPVLTSEVLTSDGWLNTGDLGVLDNKNNLFIKGRLKNIILGSSGENIYPEEIESVINNFRYVVESLVLEKKGKLIAMVHLNMEELEEKYNCLKEEFSRKFDDIIEEILNELKEYVNTRVNKNSRIQLVLLQKEPFHKTATLKVKRFLYY